MKTALRQSLVILLALAAWFGSTGGVRAATTVRVIETWPPGTQVNLARNENFYLRIAYETDQPVGIWATAYFKGERAMVGSNPSQTYSGSGETFGWFFFMKPGDQVDEVRITAGDGSTANTPVAATWRGLVVGGSQPANGQAQPAWISEMSARAKAAQDAEYKARMNTPVSVGDMALFNVFMLAMLGLGVLGFAAPAWGIWRWRGGWRLAAIAPAAVMAFVVLRLMFDVARDDTSHNLWPFEILMYGGFSTAAMAVLWLVRKLSGADRTVT